jgi:hypothetical protein
MFRHVNVRQHSTFDADVPTEMLEDSTYFDEDDDPTPAFDEWMQENGVESNIEHDEVDEDDDLWFDVDIEGVRK